MVNLTQVCMKYMPHYLRRPEHKSAFFRRQALFRLTGTFNGLSQNCWRVAIRKWHKKEEYRAEFRQRLRIHRNDLHAQRLVAAVEEHDFKMEYLITSLTISNIELSRKTLSQLAIYEPRTFKSLVDLAKVAFYEENLDNLPENFDLPEGVITRGMLRED